MSLVAYRKFKLSDQFISNFEGKQPKWGPLGYVVFARTYARNTPEGGKEEFWQTLRRVTEGIFNLQKKHCYRLGLAWDNAKSQKTAQEMYTAMWNFKFIPAGRMLWMAGTDFVEERSGAGLFNCAFVSTEDIDRQGAKPFAFIMDGLMLGVGMGFDTKGEGKLTIKEPEISDSTFVISDTREGWVESTEILINSYLLGMKLPKFDYTQIRGPGLPIKGFGGISSGPQPLIDLHENLIRLLSPKIGEPITSVDIVDIENFISVCVIAGNVRRGAALAAGRPDDKAFMEMKHDQEKLYTHRYSSNNSILAKLGMNYSEVAEHTAKQGEPGYIWLDNMRTKGRFKDGYNFDNVSGINPCFSGDMWILTDRGNVLFKDAVGERTLITEKGEQRKGKIWKSGEKEIYKISFSNGEILECTEDHVLVTEDGEQLQARDCLHKRIKRFDATHIPEVVCIEYMYTGSVYDFSIDSPTHLGVVNGFIVHNCGEQQLESYELCCVSSDTRIQTKTGCPKIEDVVGESVEVWNGENWSRVVPFVAGHNKEFYDVVISDGSKLRCTPDHRWVVRGKTKRKFSEKQTTELLPGDTVTPFCLGDIEGKHVPEAYSLGVFAGDGYLDTNRPMVSLHGDKIDLPIEGVRYKKQWPKVYSSELQRVSLVGIIPLELAKGINNREVGFPDFIFEMDKESTLNFIAGYIDTDGNLHKNANSHGYRVYGSEGKLRDLQLLFRRVGINHTRLRVMSKKGTVTNKGKRSRDLYEITIPSVECKSIPTKLKKATVFATGKTRNNAHPNGLQISNLKRQRIVSVTKVEEKGTSYCFTEPHNNMGVFGNVLTKQCLVETFPINHDSLEEYKQTLKLAYLFAKSTTLSNTHWPETNAKMLKNRRIGLSQSGIQQARIKFGTNTLLQWCDEGYAYLQELDQKYSDWLCIPRSKRMTTVKPSGTVSLLPQVTPGIHFPEAEYYIRRVRFEKESPLVGLLQKAGYPIEEDAYNKKSLVVEFPVKEMFFSRTKKEVSMWEQLEFAAKYQHYWSDNCVSITVTFKPEEASQIKYALSLYQDRLKTVSFLPLKEHGYKQAPYEEITKEEYEKRTKDLKELDLSSYTAEGTGEKYCDGESCTV